jgi:TonB family protein
MCIKIDQYAYFNVLINLKHHEIVKLTTSNLFKFLFLLAMVISTSSCTSDKKAEDATNEEDMEQMDEMGSEATKDKSGMKDNDDAESEEKNGASSSKAKDSGNDMAKAYDPEEDHSEMIGKVAVPYSATTEAIPAEKLENVEYNDEPLVIAEHWPYYGDCANLNTDAAEKRRCSNREFVKKVSSMIQYPEEARENGAEGKVVVELIIDENGRVYSSKVVNDLVGYRADQEALRVVNAAGSWTPAEHKGRPVKFKMLLPIDFRLAE